VAIGAFDDSRRIDATLQRALQNSFRHVMPLSFSAARIDRDARGGKNVLPGPLPACLRVFAIQRTRQINFSEPVFQILLVLRFYF